MTTLSPTGTAPDQRTQVVASILMICAGYFLYSFTDGLVKLLGEKFHFSQVLFCSRLAMLGFIVLYGALTIGRKAFVTKRPWLIAVSGFLGVLTGTLNIIALPHIDMTAFYTLIFTSPFWVAILSVFFLKEKLDKEKIAVILVGFAAVMYVFQPGSGALSFAALLSLASAVVYSFSIVLVRFLGQGESRVVIACGSSLVGLLISLPFLPFHYVAATPLEMTYMVLIGVLGAIGMLCVYYAMQNAPSAATVAPFHYTQIVWGAGFGYLMFADIPDARTLTGAAVIIGAGLYLLLSASRRKRRAAKKV